MSGYEFSLADLRAAQDIVYAAMPPTPQYAWPLLRQRLGTEVWVKHENHTPTGAFKVRGGLVYTTRLRASEPGVSGILSATRGNHGQSLAFAGTRLGLRVRIYVPQGNSVEKNAAMRGFGAELVEHGPDFDAARLECMRAAAASGDRFVPSFHPDLVLGVATYALEFLQHAPPLDVLYVPIGMGSGICGCIRVRDLLGLHTEIVGVQSSAAPCYYESLRQGRVVNLDSAHTRADGVATRMPDPAALAQIAKGVSRIVLVNDDEVAAAIRAYHHDTHNLAEGAGAAPLAAAMQERDRLAGKRVGLVLCGGNIDQQWLKEWVWA